MSPELREIHKRLDLASKRHILLSKAIICLAVVQFIITMSRFLKS